MNIETFKKVKNLVESFPNVSLVSLLENQDIIIKNNINNGMYKVTYGFNEDNESYFIDTNDFEIIQEGEKIKTLRDEFISNCQKLEVGLSKVFSENIEEGIEKLKETIKTLPNITDTVLFEENTYEDEDEGTEEEYIEWIKDRFSKQLTQYFKEEKDFQNMLTIFDKNQNIKIGVFESIEDIKKQLKQRSQDLNEFKQFVEKYKEAKTSIMEAIGDDKSSEVFFTNLDFNLNPSVALTKSLIKVKQFNEDFKVIEKTREILPLLENIMAPINGAPSPVAFNMASDNKFRPRFLKFKMGIYTPEDVKTMINEVDYYLSCFGDLDDESLSTLSNIKWQLEYMYHSGQINDHLIQEIIETFNKKYAKDQSDDYNNSAKQLAFKSFDQSKEGNAQGMA